MSGSSGVLRLAQALSWTALLLVAIVILLLLLMETDVGLSSELVASISFLAGILAPVVAIFAYAVTKLSGNRVSRVTVMALVVGSIVFLWPALFILAFSNCPNSVC